MNYKQLYHEYIQDHYQHPRHKGRLDPHDHIIHIINPACGDELTLYVQLHKDHHTTLMFEGKGCIISLATASMVMEYLQNKNIKEIEKISPNDIKALIKIELGPNRLQCALLSFDAIKKLIIAIHQQ